MLIIALSGKRVSGIRVAIHTARRLRQSRNLAKERARIRRR
jgi:hypothetical protein